MKLLKTTFIVMVLGVISFVLLGCHSDEATSTEQVVTVQRGNLVTQITSIGNLAFSQTTNVRFNIDCTVSEVLVKSGDSVKQGQALCRFDESSWQDAITALRNLATAALRDLTSKQRGVTQAQQDLATAQQDLIAANNTVLTKQIALLQAQINLQTAQLALEQAELTTTDQLQIQLKQLQVQLAQGQLNYAQTDLDNAIKYTVPNAQAAVDDAIAAVDDAEAAVVDAQTALDEANQNLSVALADGAEVKAPLDGLVTEVDVTGDQDVKTGDVAAIIADPDKFEASIMVSELNILKVKLGGAATVQVEVLSGVTIPATVSTISPVATIQSGVVNFEVTVQLSSLSSITSNQTGRSNFSGSGNFSGGGPGNFGQTSGSENLTQEQINQFMQQMQQQMQAAANVQLLQGLTVTVSIITGQAIDVLLVPTAAIISQGGQTTVQVMVNGVAESRVVQTGISNSQYTEITSGLSEGDQVLETQTSSGSQQTTNTGGPPGGIFFGR